MRALGFERFAVAGHDRGGRVAYRMALDSPDRVARLPLLDIIPTGEALRRADVHLALGYWPWVLLAQPAPLPERMILSNPDVVVDNALQGWGSDRASFPNEVRDAYIAALRDEATVHAICEEYRAAATIDRAHDETDLKAARRIACRVLALWSGNGALASWYGDEGGPLGVWRRWAQSVEGRPVEGGHFFPEEMPDTTADLIRKFLS